MDNYPSWNEKLFPTLMRCEKTHFWGYAMSPQGYILGISSPDPIASYSIVYKQYLHRIYTVSLDLLNPGPLPLRHPQSLDFLSAGQSRKWTVFLEEVKDLENIKPQLSKTIKAPMIEIDRYTIEPGKAAIIKVYSDEEISLQVNMPDDTICSLSVDNAGESIYSCQFKPENGFGVYTLKATSVSGKISEAKICLRRPWSWYLKQARREAIRCRQKASTHVESYYGLSSMFLAQKYFPDAVLDGQSEAVFNEIYPLMYDAEKKMPKVSSHPDRIQNSALMASFLVDRYQATGDLWNLQQASGLVDFLLTMQKPDGGFYNKNTHYTSVIYIAKSIMEVMLEEKIIGKTQPQWHQVYERHYNAVRRAIDDLERKRDNVQTEGEHTFEDGMISCSFSQLAMFACIQSDAELRNKYKLAALELASKHRCLSQIIIPDCRMNGGSLRFWESQYDILTTPNMMNSVHGWSAWRIYGLWYIYLLTGDENWLQQTQNAIGSCVQVIDNQTGKLRWGFVPDPYIKANVWIENPQEPGKGHRASKIIGEQYMEMIS